MDSSNMYPRTDRSLEYDEISSENPPGLYAASNGYMLVVVNPDGTSQAYGPIWPLTPPTMADFPVVYNGVSADDSRGVLVVASSSSGPSYGGRFRNVPALTAGQIYTADLLINPAVPYENGANCSVAVAAQDESSIITVGPAFDTAHADGKIMMEVCQINTLGIDSRIRLATFNIGSLQRMWLQVVFSDDAVSLSYSTVPYRWQEIIAAYGSFPSPIMVGVGMWRPAGAEIRQEVDVYSFTENIT